MNPQQMYEACTDALGAFVRSAGFTDVVIGLSGGMDSTLVAVMAHDALGADHVHGVMLPGPYSSESSIDDAEALAANLGISNITVPICEPFEAFEAVLARACGGALIGLAAENTQARCRMVCLMALSNAHGWLMLNTGNKSEAAMGYSTLYGDTAGAFAPLGGVYKTDVFAMARWRNRRAVEEGTCGPIPVNVFVKPPSAELAPDQEDEKSLGRRLRHAGSDSHRLCGRGEGRGGHRRRERPEPRFGGLRRRPYRRQRLQTRFGASVP